MQAVAATFEPTPLPGSSEPPLVLLSVVFDVSFAFLSAMYVPRRMRLHSI